MKKPQLEARLKDKTLVVKWKKGLGHLLPWSKRREFQLDESLFNAEPNLSHDEENALNLEYRNTDEDFAQAEAGDIHSFFEAIGLDKGIEVSPCGPYDGRNYSTVALVGNFDASVYR